MSEANLGSLDSILQKSVEEALRRRIEDIWLSVRDQLIREIDKEAARVCAAAVVQMFRTAKIHCVEKHLIIEVKLPEGEQPK